MPLTDALPVTPLTALPLFPLGMVLYPGGFLPLQIFEVRYLDMIGKCHKNGTPFGVVSLTEGTEVRRLNAEPTGDAFANEAFQSIGTLATITDFATPQSGLMVVRCTGTQRFKISRSEKLKHGLWVADATLLPDDTVVPIPDDLQPAAEALKKLILTLQERDVAAEQMPILKPYQFDDCGWVANRWSELLPIPVALKQQFMELDNPLLRLELINDILDRSDIVF
ncbi:MAG: Lon protease-like protein [Polaromonas sp.]|jgi:Lon protease-like protein